MARKKTSLSSTIAALQAAEARAQQLRARALSERARELTTLHARLGFGARHELIEALLALDGARQQKAPRTAPAVRTETRKRARITSELRQSIIDAVQAGGAGADVAERFGISIGSVHNIKKAAGLVRKRA